MNERLHKWLTDNAESASRGESIWDEHVDELDSRFAAKENWLSGLQELLAEGIAFVKAGYPDLILTGGISLRSDAQPIGYNFTNMPELERELPNHTPPSLYLFLIGKAPWDQLEGFHLIESTTLFNKLSTATIRYLEYKEQNEADYRRSLWIA